MKSKRTTPADFYAALIESNCTKEAVRKRRQWVRQLLGKYKSGTIGEAEKRFLTIHIREFMSYPKSEIEDRCAQILCLFFLSPHPPTAKQLAEQYHIDRTTVFNNINSAINDLTVVIFGISGIEMALPPLAKATAQKCIEDSVQLIADMAIEMHSQSDEMAIKMCHYKKGK